MMDQSTIARTATTTATTPTISDSTAQTKERFAERSDARAYSSRDERRCWKPASSSRECSTYLDMKGSERHKGADGFLPFAGVLLGIAVLLLLVGVVVMFQNKAVGSVLVCVAAIINVTAAALTTITAWRNWQEVKRSLERTSRLSVACSSRSRRTAMSDAAMKHDEHKTVA